MTEKKKWLALQTPERRREIARLGGLATAKKKDHMSTIGKLGGRTVSQDRAHMAEIGRRGGSRQKAKDEQKAAKETT